MERLYRSRREKKIAGLCGGIAELIDADPTLIRLGLLLLCFVTGVFPVVLTYLIAWMIVPIEEYR